MSLDPTVARRTWRTLEPFHGMIYFVPEADERYRALGVQGRAGYFASRAAPMGAVPAEVVIATFFNFHPALVQAAIPSAWDAASPAALVAARLDAADAALRRLSPDAVGSPEVKEAAALARTAALAACDHVEGRPLFAGHASLGWPEEDHLALWHAVSLLREFRGDGHIAALTAEGVGGCEALVLHGATGDVPPAVLQASRAWPDDEWAAARDRVQERGWIDGDGAMTAPGAAHRAWVEDRTDQLAVEAWAAIGEDGCARLRELVRPWSRALVESGEFSLRG
jgi:helix-turn-helix protein